MRTVVAFGKSCQPNPWPANDDGRLAAATTDLARVESTAFFELIVSSLGGLFTSERNARGLARFCSHFHQVLD
jgi:hypothetical protein